MKIKLLFLYVFEFLRDGYYVGIFLLLPFLVKDLHLSLFQVGSLQTVISILAIILAIPGTFFSAKFGGLKILLFSLPLYSIAFLGINFSNSYQLLLFLFFIAGTGFSFYSVISSHLITTWSKKETQGKQLGNLMATGDVAKAIMSVLIGFLVGTAGWRMTSLSIGIFTALVFLTFFYLYQKYIGSQEKDEIISQKKLPVSYSYFLKQKRFILALTANALDMAVNVPLYAFLPFLLIYKGVPLAWLGIFTAFYYVGNTVSRLVFGRLIDKIGNAKIFIMLEVTMAAITLLLAISPSLVLTGFLALLLGFITEGTDPATLSMVATSLEHVENPKKAYGIRAITNGLAKAISPLILGFAAIKLGTVGIFYVLAFLTLLPIIPALIFLKTKSQK